MKVMKLEIDYKKRGKAAAWLRQYYGGKSHETWFEGEPYRTLDGNPIQEFFVTMNNKSYLSLFRMKFCDGKIAVVDLTPELKERCSAVYIDDIIHLVGGDYPSRDYVKYFCRMQSLGIDHIISMPEKIKAAADLWIQFPKNDDDANLISDCFYEIVSVNAPQSVNVDAVIYRIKRKLHQFFRYGNPIKLIWQIGWQLTDSGIFDWAQSLSVMMNVVNLVRPFHLNGGIDYHIKEYQRKTGRVCSPKMPPHLRQNANGSAA